MSSPSFNMQPTIGLIIAFWQRKDAFYAWAKLESNHKVIDAIGWKLSILQNAISVLTKLKCGHVLLRLLQLEDSDSVRKIINNPLWRGNTALTEACYAGNKELAEFLIANDADIKSRGRGLFISPLCAAGHSGHDVLARWLLNQGANPIPRPTDCRALDSAAAVARWLLNQGQIPRPTDYSALNSATAADYSAKRVRRSEDAGNTSLNAVADSPLRAMMSSCRLNQTRLVGALIRHGMDPNGRDEEYYGQGRPLWSRFPNTEPNAKTYHPLVMACRYNSKDVVKLLLDEGADIDLPDEDGTTALIVSCGLGYREIVYVLLDRGAEVNLPVQPGSDYTPLLKAVESGENLEIVRMLLDRGAEVNLPVQPGCGYTPLIKACLSGNKSIVKELLDRGAEIDARSRHVETALQIVKRKLSNRTRRQKCVEEDWEAIVNLLVERGAATLTDSEAESRKHVDGSDYPQP